MSGSVVSFPVSGELYESFERYYLGKNRETFINGLSKNCEESGASSEQVYLVLKNFFLERGQTENFYRVSSEKARKILEMTESELPGFEELSGKDRYKALRKALVEKASAIRNVPQESVHRHFGHGAMAHVVSEAAGISRSAAKELIRSARNTLVAKEEFSGPENRDRILEKAAQKVSKILKKDPEEVRKSFASVVIADLEHACKTAGLSSEQTRSVINARFI